MHLSHLKTPLLLGGVSTAGVGGSGFAVGVVYKKAHPTAQKWIDEKGLKRSPLSAGGLGAHNTSFSVSYNENPTTNTSSCFKNFFPGAETISLSEKHANKTVSTLNGPTKTSASTIQGCALAQLAYKHNESKKDSFGNIIDGLDFKSEVVFKNDHVGWAIGTLWNGGKVNEDGSETWWQTLHYYVVFLEKSDSENKGSIKGGYKWEDEYGSNDTYKSVQIEMPSGNVGLKHGSNLSNIAEDDKWHTKQFIGRWEESPGGKEILSGIDIQAPQKNNKGLVNSQCELFCKDKDGKNFSERTADDSQPPGFTKESFHFSKDEETWKVKSASDQEDISEKLDNGFAPFKGKKGQGTKLEEEFCDGHLKKLFPSKQDLIKLENFCYSKDSQSLT